MTSVFVSYSHLDAEVADQICQVLSDLQIQLWRDCKDIEPGRSIPDRIAEGIKKSSDLLVILSPASVRSNWVSYEVGQAIALGKTVVPFLTHPAIEIPDYLQNRKRLTSINEVRKHYMHCLHGRLPRPFKIEFIAEGCFVRALMLAGFALMMAFYVAMFRSWDRVAWIGMGVAFGVGFLACLAASLVKRTTQRTIVLTTEGIVLSEALRRPITYHWDDVVVAGVEHAEIHSKKEDVFSGRREIKSILYIVFREEDDKERVVRIPLEDVRVSISELEAAFTRKVPNLFRHTFSAATMGDSPE